MIQFGRDGHLYLILDTNTAKELRLNRHEAKAAARFLMKELGVVSARLDDGTDVCLIDKLFIELPAAGGTELPHAKNDSGDVSG